MQRNGVQILHPAQLENFLDPAHSVFRSDNAVDGKFGMLGFDRLVRFFEQFKIVIGLGISRAIAPFAKSAMELIVGFHRDQLVFIVLHIRFRVIGEPLAACVRVWRSTIVIERIVVSGDKHHPDVVLFQFSHIIVRDGTERIHPFGLLDLFPFQPVPDGFHACLLNDRNRILLSPVQMGCHPEWRIRHGLEVISRQNGKCSLQFYRL
ncbi:hypothetical protein D3C73_1074540 [compost metagenome]